MGSERLENEELVPIKKKMKDYTKDVPLTSIAPDEAVKFLGSSLASSLIGSSQQIGWTMVV